MTTFIATYTPNIKIGIANYLKVVFSCYRLNYIIYGRDQKFKCIDKDFKHIFSSIFTNNELILYETSNKICGHTVLNETFPYFKNIQILLNKNEKKIYKVDGWRFYVHPNDNVNISPFCSESHLRNCNWAIDFRYNNIPKHIQEKYINIINKFKINDKIIQNVDSFVSNTIKDEFLGVHIRTWCNNNTFQDDRSSCERYNHYLSVRDNFVNNINKSEQNVVLICTDNKTEIQYIIDKIINKKVLFYIEDPECNNLQNDFSELLLLSKSSKLIGSFNSTFTELAWWYSNCSIMVIII